ncbi:hypothetical protein RMATCC62417_00402 [Rhizopus microsporus]|nr:hypothetical protein RMATCC62417_00402 [Rhizopus microsporus]CEJ00237.1 hypothetical protein RMCBS344292_14298 [Rhizopus microsporus]
MGKAKRDQQKKTTPYSRPTTIKKKPITKAEKLKNKSITEDLDKNIEELTQQLRPKKKKQIQIRNDDMDNDEKIERQQLEYEKTQNDLDDALSLLTRL